jgi:hypothetical protein
MLNGNLHLKLLGLFFFASLFVNTHCILAQNATIGDKVWNDMNNNGIQESSEPGMGNIWVFLQDANGADVDFDITDSFGNYSFSVAPGSYRIKFANPGGLVPPQQGVGSPDKDSDIDIAGFTSVFTVSADEVNNDIDAGFSGPSQGCTLVATQVDMLDCGNSTFTVTINVVGGGDWGWTSSTGQTGDYGVPATFGPFSNSADEICIGFIDMDNPTCVTDICITPDCPFCDPLTAGGVIEGDESRCGPYNPSPITNLELPEGGTGDIEYMWLSSTDDCMLFDISNRIFGADGPDYDPPTINQTTYYQRWSRRADCPMWTLGQSNCIVKEVLTDPDLVLDKCGQICEPRKASNATEDCDDGESYTLYFPHAILGIEQSQYSDYWYIQDGLMTEYTDGNAVYTGRLRNRTNGDMYLDLTLDLIDRTFHPQPNSPNPSDCFDVNDSDWYYYKSFTGSLVGHGALEGGILNISQKGANFQAGTGANLLNENIFGASASFFYTVLSQPDNSLTFYKQTTMSFATTLTGGVSNCVPEGAECCDNSNVLFVVGDFELDASDTAVKDRLEAKGYTVTLQLDYLSQPWDAMGYGLVMISSTASSAHVRGTFADVEVPVLTYEAWVYDNMYMAQGGSQTQLGLNWGKYITVEDDTHPLSIGRTGKYKVYNKNRPLTWGMPMGDGVGVAIVNSVPGEFGMLAYDQGDIMTGGEIAPARRVGFFLGNESGEYMTEDGWEFFDAAVTWAIDCRLTTTTLPTIGMDGDVNQDLIDQDLTPAKEINIYPNPTTGDIFFNLKAYEGEEMHITVFNQVGQVMKYIYVEESYGTIETELRELNNGYYLVQFETATEGLVSTQKLIVRK